MSETYEIVGGSVLAAGGFETRPLAVAGGRIAARGGAGGTRLDATGCLVLPGAIDLHGDAFERQLAPRPGVTFPFGLALADNDRQLAASGITTAYYSVTLSYEPGLRSVAASAAFIDDLLAARDGLAADSRIHLRYEVQAADAMEPILGWLESEAVGLLSFNDHLEMSRADLEKPGKRETFFARTGLDRAGYAALLDRVSAEPRDSAQARMRTLAEAARHHGLPVMAHDPESPEAIAEAVALGCTIAEFPTNLATAEAARDAGLPAVMGAPNVLRGGSHKGFVAAHDLVVRGLCAVLTSDYSYPALVQAPFLLAARHGVDLADGWALVSSGPADAAGLADRGRLEEGLRADVVVVEPPRHPGDVARVVATLAGGRLVNLADGARLMA